MISLINIGKRLDNIVSYIKNQSPQDTWIIDSIVPLFLEAINQNLSSQEEKLIISKVNQLIDSYEFRYGKIFENNSLITEVSDETLDLQQKFFNDMLVNKSKIVQRYGKDAEKVMKGKAMNLAKKETEKMNKQKLKELVRKSLMQEADIEVGAEKFMGEKELAQASMMLDDFESKLKSHDWYYMMSDDNRAYTKGRAEESDLKELAKQLAKIGYGDDAAKVYDQYNVFKNTSFDSFIAPPQPFIPGYKRKEMGLDETEFSKEYDNDPALKGKQKELPDALQKAIIAKKGVKEAYSEESELDKYERILYQLQNMNRSSNPSDESTKRKKIEDLKKKIAKLKSKVTEGYYGTTNVESYIDALGYESFEDFFENNPGGEDALMNWIESVPEFRQSLEGAGLLSEDIDLGHEDNEPHMIKGELYQIGKYSMELYAALEELEEMGGEIDFPAWWQAKITTAKNNISGAKHYLEFEMNEPKIDATVDALTGEEPHEGEPMPPMMESAYDYVKTPKEYVALQLSDFFGVPKNRLMSFNLDGTDDINALTKVLNSTSNQGTEMILKMSIKSAQEHFDSPIMNEAFTIDTWAASGGDTVEDILNDKGIDYTRNASKITIMLDRNSPSASSILSHLKNKLGVKFDEVDDEEVSAQRQREKQRANVFAEVNKGYFKKEFGIGKKKSTKEEIEEIAKKVAEGSYPWDKCIADQTPKYGKEGAAKVCGAIKAAYAEGLEEKKLTKAEKSKKEDIVKGMKKSFKGDESAMYAIATAKAKKVAETIVKKLKND